MDSKSESAMRDKIERLTGRRPSSREMDRHIEAAQKVAKDKRGSKGVATAESRDAAGEWVRERARRTAAEGGGDPDATERQTAEYLRDGDAKERDRGKR